MDRHLHEMSGLPNSGDHLSRQSKLAFLRFTFFRADNAKARPATAAAAAPAPLPVSRPPSPEIPPMPPFPGETDNNVQQGESSGSNSVFPPQLHPPARTHASMPSTRLSMMHTPPGEVPWIELYQGSLLFPKI